MANPPITALVPGPTTLTVIAGNVKFTFPWSKDVAGLPLPFTDVLTLQTHTDASIAAATALILAAVKSQPTPTPPVTTPNPPAPTTKADVVNVGPARGLTEIADAIPLTNSGGTIVVDDGVYKKPFHNDNWDLKIKSASGNPRTCIIDGQGGNGGGHRMAYDKAMCHTSAQLSISGIGFINCGSLTSDSNHSNEAAIYAESFPKKGTLMVAYCTFDNNANGIFIPADPGLSGSIDYYEKISVFGLIHPNSQSNPNNSGPSHDRYIGGASIHIDGSWNFGCNNGHSLKSCSPNLLVENCPWIASWGGRAIELPHGGVGIVRNCTTVSRDDAGSNSNFIGLCDEDNSIGGTPSLTFDGGKILIGRSPSAFAIGQGTITINPNVAVSYYDSGQVSTSGGGSLVGLAQGRDPKNPVLPSPTLPVPPIFS